MNIKISTIARKVFNTLFAKCSHEGFTVSGRYSVINRDVAPNLSRGWQEEVIAERQHSAFYPLLREMRNGNPREDFIALANAVKKTGEKNPVIFEVGCGSGWNSDVLECLLDFSVKYVGVDYSPSMIAAAQKYYPGRKFMLGDAYCLPIKDGGCDILLSGTVLMHLADYPSAIAESRRVSRKWCIFHTVPVLRERSTTILKKHAYGVPVVEVIYNEKELLALFGKCGLVVEAVFSSIPYDLYDQLGEHTVTKTFLTRIGKAQ